MNLDAERFFAAMANEIRLRLLLLLQAEGELCVCELTGALGLSQPMISRHLALLRESSLLVARRQGTWMYYRIDPDLPAWAQAVLQAALEGNRRRKPFTVDRKRLAGMSGRPAAGCCA